MGHIEDCLDEMAMSQHHVGGNIFVVAFALWFHDVIYDTRSLESYNEKRSAQLAKGVIYKAGLPDSFGQMVTNAILATKHTGVVEDYDAQVVCDIDLASLGAPWEVFEENGRKIRFEYKHVPEDIFLKGRKRILKSFLDRENIYYLPYFRDKYEAQARQNLTWVVEKLSKRLKYWTLDSSG